MQPCFEDSSKKIKLKQDGGSKASLCDTVDFDDPMMINWISIKGVRAALEHHCDDPGDFEGLDYHDQVKELCTKFTPSEARPALQGILTDSGKDWRTLKLNKLHLLPSLQRHALIQ